MAGRGGSAPQKGVDRHQQMSSQQQLIEEKKRQILNRLHDKRRLAAADESAKSAETKNKNAQLGTKPSTSNMFTNDGSFLDQFQKFAGQNKSEIENLQIKRERSRSPYRTMASQNQNQAATPTSSPVLLTGSSGWACGAPGYAPPVPPPLVPHSIPSPSPLVPQMIPPPRPMDVHKIPPPGAPLSLHQIPPPPAPPLNFMPPPHFFAIAPPPPPVHPGLALPSLPVATPDNGRSFPAGSLISYPVKREPLDSSCSKSSEDVKPEIDYGLNPVASSKTVEDVKVKNEPKEEDDYLSAHVKEEDGDSGKPSTSDLETKYDDDSKKGNELGLKSETKEEIKTGGCSSSSSKESSEESAKNREKRRKSRWGEKAEEIPPPVMANIPVPTTVPKIKVPGMTGHMISKVTRTEPGLVQYAIQAYGSAELSEEDWKKAEDNYKVHLLYQDLLTKRAEVDRLNKKGKHKYEYDSDEDTEGGTWEHRVREKEMLATRTWADTLTEMAKGKHHIGDFLPPDELKRFMDKYSALKGGKEPDLSDYKEYKLTEENKGFKMLQKLGWSEGQGLGSDGGGIVEPINKARMRDNNQGLGVTNPGDVDGDDDEYAAYRKRMMLAYRFRPNPLNNPRRPYY